METTTVAEQLAGAQYGAPVTVMLGESRRVTLALKLIAYGFQVFTLTVEERCACCGEWREVGRDSLGGIEPFLDREYAADVAGQLLAAVGA